MDGHGTTKQNDPRTKQTHRRQKKLVATQQTHHVHNSLVLTSLGPQHQGTCHHAFLRHILTVLLSRNGPVGCHQRVNMSPTHTLVDASRPAALSEGRTAAPVALLPSAPAAAATAAAIAVSPQTHHLPTYAKAHRNDPHHTIHPETPPHPRTHPSAHSAYLG